MDDDWSEQPRTLSTTQQSNINESTKTVNNPCIYVKHLPENITKDDLMDIFAKYGNVLLMPFLNKDKNFAIVTYETQEAASKAITAENGQPPLFLNCSMAYRKKDWDLSQPASHGPRMVVNKFSGGKKFLGRGAASHRPNTYGARRSSPGDHIPSGRNDEKQQPGEGNQEAQSRDQRQRRPFNKNFPTKNTDRSRSKSGRGRGRNSNNYRHSKPRNDTGDWESGSDGGLNKKFDNLTVSDRNATGLNSTSVAGSGFNKPVVTNSELESKWQEESKNNVNPYLATNRDSNKTRSNEYANRSSQKYETSRVSLSQVHDTASTLSSVKSETKCQTQSKVSDSTGNPDCRVKVYGNENMIAVYKKPFSKPKIDAILDNILNKMESNSTCVDDVPGLRWGAGCGWCGRGAVWQCARCSRQQYCSRACQVAHWPAAHHAVCSLSTPTSPGSVTRA